ncbi:omptin family outer membrane protease [Nitratireductor sp. B36]|uniref:omptin family outer membrane protease n=1 Tax=Nitratireductor sp. B36 TaxID=2762059 RepID=UPI001E4EA049|nr:omptin family outer membrane protease [Nitratireductor sp. B36]MCC5780474.1 omptin family outer membrane protease [Nitratireductor sp. B36]
MHKFFISTAFLISVLPTSAPAADLAIPDRLEVTSQDRAVTFIGGVGYTFLEAEEIVYDSAGNRISALFWESEAPVLTGGLRARLAGPWTLAANATVGLSGNSGMEDYDWLDASPSYAFNDWSDRSVHPDTELNHYFTGDIALGRDFEIRDSVTLNLHGGFTYTDVKWTAFGGSYVYSENGFRDEQGDFRDSERGISYQQKFPGVFIGAEATSRHKGWTFSLQARGGLNFKVEDEDHHWSRDLRFNGDFGTMPFLSLSGRVEHSISNNANLFLAGSFEQHFDRIGDVRISEIASGTPVGTFWNGGGLGFRAITLSGGFKMRF